ncbi:MAG: dTDP-4-dehydrorhamnose 3,5-epimerase [Clostridiaceae bacterium]
MTQPFRFDPLPLEGAYCVTPFSAFDERGGFIKDYSAEAFAVNGISHPLKEVFYTLSHRGVMRALHFQLQRQQAKLVRCVSGHVYDVIVDLRPGSPTFGQWLGFDLTGENRTSLYVPRYFGHGYLVLEESIVSYQCAESFFAEGDSGILWNDPDLAIRWPLEKIGGADHMILSQKDQNLMRFCDYAALMKKSAGALETNG